MNREDLLAKCPKLRLVLSEHLGLVRDSGEEHATSRAEIEKAVRLELEKHAAALDEVLAVINAPAPKDVWSMPSLSGVIVVDGRRLGRFAAMSQRRITPPALTPVAWEFTQCAGNAETLAYMRDRRTVHVVWATDDGSVERSGEFYMIEMVTEPDLAMHRMRWGLRMEDDSSNKIRCVGFIDEAVRDGDAR